MKLVKNSMEWTRIKLLQTYKHLLLQQFIHLFWWNASYKNQPSTFTFKQLQHSKDLALRRPFAAYIQFSKLYHFTKTSMNYIRYMAIVYTRYSIHLLQVRHLILFVSLNTFVVYNFFFFQLWINNLVTIDNRFHILRQFSILILYRTFFFQSNPLFGNPSILMGRVLHFYDTKGVLELSNKIQIRKGPKI